LGQILIKCRPFSEGIQRRDPKKIKSPITNLSDNIFIFFPTPNLMRTYYPGHHTFRTDVVITIPHLCYPSLVTAHTCLGQHLQMKASFCELGLKLATAMKVAPS
jgi:hypothetical protein